MKIFTFMAIVVIYGLSSTTLLGQDFWQHTGGPLGGTTVCAAEADNGDLILGTVEGIFRSSDAGATWAHSENGIESTNAITDIFKHSNGDIYAIGSDRILGHSRLFRSLITDKIGMRYRMFLYFPPQLLLSLLLLIAVVIYLSRVQLWEVL